MAIDLVNVAAGAGGFVIHGQEANDVAGRSVSSAGDVNGDGFDDVIIGAPSADGPGNTRPGGRQLCGVRQGLWLRGGDRPRRGRRAAMAASSSMARMRAIRPAIRSPRPATSTATASMTFSSALWSPTAPATHVTRQATAMWCSVTRAALRRRSTSRRSRAATAASSSMAQDANDISGFSVSSAGDINGDGFADLIIGAEGADGPGNSSDHAGASYVVFGHAGGFAAEHRPRRRRAATAASSSTARTRATPPAGRSPPPVTSTATASTTSSSAL